MARKSSRRGAVGLIAGASDGLTRRINILADKALLSAFTENGHAVTPSHVRAAVQDSEFAAVRPRRRARTLAVAATALVAGLALGLAAQWMWTTKPQPAVAAVGAEPVSAPAPAAAPVVAPEPAPPQGAPSAPPHLSPEQAGRLERYSPAGHRLLAERIAATRAALDAGPGRGILDRALHYRQQRPGANGAVPDPSARLRPARGAFRHPGGGRRASSACASCTANSPPASRPRPPKSVFRRGIRKPSGPGCAVLASCAIKFRREDKKCLRDRCLHHFPQAILMVCLPPEGVLTMTLGRLGAAALLAAFAAGCGHTPPKPAATHIRAPDARAEADIPPPVQVSPMLPQPKPTARPETYSVVVNNVRVQELLFALARDARLNVDIHPTSRHGHAQRHRPDAASAARAHRAPGRHALRDPGAEPDGDARLRRTCGLYKIDYLSASAQREDAARPLPRSSALAAARPRRPRPPPPAARRRSMSSPKTSCGSR